MAISIEQGVFKKMYKILDKMDVILDRMGKSVIVLDEMVDEEEKEERARALPKLRLVK